MAVAPTRPAPSECGIVAAVDDAVVTSHNENCPSPGEATGKPGSGLSVESTPPNTRTRPGATCASEAGGVTSGTCSAARWILSRDAVAGRNSAADDVLIHRKRTQIERYLRQLTERAVPLEARSFVHGIPLIHRRKSVGFAPQRQGPAVTSCQLSDAAVIAGSRHRATKTRPAALSGSAIGVPSSSTQACASKPAAPRRTPIRTTARETPSAVRRPRSAVARMRQAESPGTQRSARSTAVPHRALRHRSCGESARASGATAADLSAFDQCTDRPIAQPCVWHGSPRVPPSQRQARRASSAPAGQSPQRCHGIDHEPFDREVGEQLPDVADHLGRRRVRPATAYGADQCLLATTHQPRAPARSPFRSHSDRNRPRSEDGRARCHPEAYARSRQGAEPEEASKRARESASGSRRVGPHERNARTDPPDPVGDEIMRSARTPPAIPTRGHSVPPHRRSQLQVSGRAPESAECRPRACRPS